ncbi:MAG: ABC transporter permease, partial [Anaerolineales bacterium]
MLPPTLLKTALRDFARRPWQSGLMILGIALGVAVVIAVDLANTSASRAFHLSTEAVIGRATHQLLGGSDGLPDDLYRQVRVEWGLRESAPVVEGVALAPDLDNQPLRILGVDPIAEAPFRNYFSRTAANTAGFERFYTDPDAVIVGVGLAERYGLKLNDSVRLQIGDQFKSVTIAGILTPRDASNRRALDSLLLMDVGAAQMLLDQPGRLTRIDMILTEDEVAQLAARLPDRVRLTPASTQAETVAQLTSAFQLNLTALSLLALVVGMFLIYNTVMF